MGRTGRQSPTFTNITDKYKTKGTEAVRLYKSTGQKLMPWQSEQIKNIMSVNTEKLWAYMVYGICVSRRNGKGEILAAREFYGITKSGEKILHTAHRTTTSHDAFVRLYTLLKKAGYEEHSRKQKNMPKRSFFASQQYGLEHIEIQGGGIVDFRTRTNNGGLGEGFDVLIIDEAQEYTSKQASALSYTVSASQNPQTIMVGTPPTAVSAGDVFRRIRSQVMEGKASETGWAEWSVPEMPKAIDDTELWYEYNPSLGLLLTERAIRAELANGEVDFAIQRLGLWLSYSRNSVITPGEWSALQVDDVPKLVEQRYFGVKYSRDGTTVALSIAARTVDGKVFIEAIDTAPTRLGNDWILQYLENPKMAGVVIDGASGQQALAEDMIQRKIKPAPVLPKVSEIITSSTLFETGIANQQIVHRNQPGLTAIVTNCEHRPIGSSGGFGFKALSDDQDVTLMESVVLAYWLCVTSKPKTRRQSFTY